MDAFEFEETGRGKEGESERGGEGEIVRERENASTRERERESDRASERESGLYDYQHGQHVILCNAIDARYMYDTYVRHLGRCRICTTFQLAHDLRPTASAVERIWRI